MRESPNPFAGQTNPGTAEQDRQADDFVFILGQLEAPPRRPATPSATLAPGTPPARPDDSLRRRALRATGQLIEMQQRIEAHGGADAPVLDALLDRALDALLEIAWRCRAPST